LEIIRRSHSFSLIIEGSELHSGNIERKWSMVSFHYLSEYYGL